MQEKEKKYREKTTQIGQIKWDRKKRTMSKYTHKRDKRSSKTIYNIYENACCIITKGTEKEGGNQNK
jgi:uncharacterized protein with gpF-like domain